MPFDSDDWNVCKLQLLNYGLSHKDSPWIEPGEITEYASGLTYDRTEAGSRENFLFRRKKVRNS